VHAGNTTYTANSHPNSTKPRQENNMNVNGYKHRRHTQTNKHLLRERWEYRLGTVSTWIETLYLACVCISHSPIHFMFKVMVHEFVVKIEQIKRNVNCYREIVIIFTINVSFEKRFPIESIF